MDLFERFIIEATSLFGKSAYDEFEKKFSINDKRLRQTVKRIKFFIGDSSMSQLYEEYSRPDISKVAFILNCLRAKFLIRELLKFISVNVSGTGSQTDLSELLVPAISILKKYPFFKELNGRLYFLFDAFEKNGSDYDISQKLAHCSENNLLDYLDQHLDILREDGQHLIFSLKVSKQQDFQASPLCDNCIVNFPENFKVIAKKASLDVSQRTSIRIPLIFSETKPNGLSEEDINASMEDNPDMTVVKMGCKQQ